MSNLPGGLKSRGLRIKGDDTPIAPGEWRDVDVGSGAIRDNILPLPYKEPSQVLAGLLDKIVLEGRKFASTADTNVSDMSANAPVGSTLALLERQLKVLTAVQARVHNALKSELKLLKAVIRDYTSPDYSYDPEYGTPRAKQGDYDKVDVIPVSDPNAATLSQRVVQYQAVIQMAQMAPDIYNLPELHRGMLEVLGIKNPEKLVPLEEDMKPIDPIAENQNILKCEPVKAFFYQDHDAHIMTHQFMLQDPLLAQTLGQNPKAQQIVAALTAHIAEHAGYRMRRQIETQLGMPLPPYESEMADDLPPQVELPLSAMIAQAASQALAQNQAMAAQQQAQQQAQDPVVQMQQQELQIRAQEAQIKAQKVQGDLAIKQQELQLKAQEAAAKMGEDPQIAAAKAQQELQANAMRQQQELLANARREQQSLQAQRAKMAMSEREHAAKMRQKEQEHALNIALKARQPQPSKEKPNS